jgi:hypothetical protein
MNEIDVRHDFRQPAATVFALLADHERFFPPPHYTCRLREAGSPERNGDGALREVRSGALHFLERISRFQPDRGFDYRIEVLRLGGVPLPFRHERGWVEVTPLAQGCRVVWRSRFRIALPLLGPMLARRFQRDAGRAFAWLLRDAQRRLDAA